MKLKSVITSITLPTLLASVYVEASNAGEQRTHRAIHEVVVTLPIHKDADNSALSLLQIDEQALLRSGANTLGDLAHGVPGLSESTFGPGVGRPIIRGQQGARVVVLQNGTTAADVSAVSPDHAVAVEPVLAQKVEVLRGPSSLLYAGAIGGVVNVIDNRVPTTAAERTSGSFELRHASVNDEDVGVFSIDSGIADIAFHLDGMSRESGNVEIDGAAADMPGATIGFVDNTFADTQSYTIGTSYILDNGYVGVAVNELDNNYGIPLEPMGEEISIELEQTRIDLRSVLSFDDGLVRQLRAFLSNTDYEHSEIEEGEAASTWTNETTEARIELEHKELAGFHGALGLQIDSREFEVSGEETYIPAADAWHLGVFLVEDYHFDNVRLEAGLRIDRDEVERTDGVDKADFTGVSGSLSALVQLSDVLDLGLAYAHAERAPEIEELYADGPHLAVGIYESGNPNLDSEVADSVDLTLSYDNGALQGYVTFFYNAFSDFIYLRDTQNVIVVDGDPFNEFRYTPDDATFKGVEAELSFPIAQLAGGELNGRVFGDWISGELDNGGDVPRLPPATYGVEFSYDKGGLYSSISVVDAARQSDPGEGEAETAGYTRVDAAWEYSWRYQDGELPRTATTFFRLKNLTDETIRNASSFLRDIAPEPGRSVEAGFRLAF